MVLHVSSHVLFCSGASLQAGLVRQDMHQEFEEVSLSQLFLLEEFPWADEDVDARSSLFPFQVSLSDLVLTTLPFLARQYWCKAPFNDANRIHVSGFVIEMNNDHSCDELSQNPIMSVSFVGGCHWAGTLLPLSSGCCISWICGRVWSDATWDIRVAAEMKNQRLSVVTGQFCVPSKYGSHGAGFHEVGMLCPEAEPEQNWGAGYSFVKHFVGEAVQISERQAILPAATAEIFPQLGFPFKPAVMVMLQARPEWLLATAQGQRCDEACLGN